MVCSPFLISDCVSVRDAPLSQHVSQGMDRIARSGPEVILIESQALVLNCLAIITEFEQEEGKYV